MSSEITFGHWLKQRRKALGIAQGELARQAGCATITLQKIEADERRASRQIAERLAEALDIESDKRAAFIAFARSNPASGEAFHAPTNLPTPTTPLIGREQDVADARRRLMRDDTRLLTLVGPPGIGKTRLALQVAAEVRDAFDDGAFFVPLAPISDPDLVLATVGQTLNLHEVSNRPWLDRLSDYLQFKRMLLVLDNFEQVIPAAPQVAKLLSACSLLRVIVTSRAALRVRAERLFPVPTLALPDLEHLPAVDTLAEYSAIAMFLDRAQAGAPDFVITEVNASDVAHICHRLDGLPLALELVSARVQVLTPQALHERLRGRLLLHSDSLRDMEERQRTLMNAIAWSHDLLTPAEQRLFRQLGVFVGGWMLEAAEHVCIDSNREGEAKIHQGSECLPTSQLLDTLIALVNKSMVVRQVGECETRFTMLETLREYALEQLEASDEGEALKRRHAEYFLALAQEASSHFNRVGEAQWLGRLNREQDNLRAALDWAYRASETQLLVELTLAFANFAWMGNLINESRDWLVRTLRMANSPNVSHLVRAHLLNTAGTNAYLRGDYTAAMGYHEKALAEASVEEDTNEIAFSLFMLALATLNVGDHAQAEALWLAAIPLAQKCGNRWIEAMSIGNLSTFARMRGDVDRAIHLCDEAIGLLREIGDELFATMPRNYQGAMLRQQGRHAEATAIHLECLRTTYAIGNIRETCNSLEYLACVVAAQGDCVRDARFLGATHALRQKCSVPIELAQKADYDEALTMARAQLDKAAFDAAWTDGQAMTIEQAVAYALVEEFNIKARRT